MATNRKFQGLADAVEVDLSHVFSPPGPPPEPNMVWWGPDIGWRFVVVDDPEDREPLSEAE